MKPSRRKKTKEELSNFCDDVKNFVEVFFPDIVLNDEILKWVAEQVFKSSEDKKLMIPYTKKSYKGYSIHTIVVDEKSTEGFRRNYIFS